MRFGIVTAVSAVALAAAAPAMAQVQIEWWHAMGGRLGEKVDQIAAGFNESQSEYQLVPSNHGSYAETMNAAIAAFRAGQQPHIVQVFEVGTGTMMAAEGAIYPVHQLMADTGVPFDPDDYLPSVTGYYTDAEGNMLSMPFNSSTPIVYYNTDKLEELDISFEGPVRTWPEFLELAGAAVQAGSGCGFTTTWPGWTQVENFSAWHNVPIGTMANGIGGLGTELLVDSPVHVAHWDALREASADGTFTYGGRASNAGPLFISGECAMLIESSAGYANVSGNADFDFVTGMLPYWPDLTEGPEGGPQNSIIGGATLWVLSGRPDEEYEGVARFFEYLSTPEVQADWHQFTGYLPITVEAAGLTLLQGFYADNPGTDVSIRQMFFSEPTENSRGLRFGNMVQIRDVVDEEFEAMLDGSKTAQEALDAVVERGNTILRQFEEDNS